MNFQSLENKWRPTDAFGLDLICYLTRVGRGERPEYNLLSLAACAGSGGCLSQRLIDTKTQDTLECIYFYIYSCCLLEMLGGLILER